jgi:hypothetical protein
MDINIIDSISADTIANGDQIIVQGDPIEVRGITYTDDIDEVIVKGWSWTEGDVVEHSLYADDYFDVWVL